ncbi:glycoside hydrolase family 9 protein [Thiohalocapsa halophila]|nr:glycoside hydrolase family 9 protein [Thiohalocapsa halophila]
MQGLASPAVAGGERRLGITTPLGLSAEQRAQTSARIPALVPAPAAAPGSLPADGPLSAAALRAQQALTLVVATTADAPAPPPAAALRLLAPDGQRLSVTHRGSDRQVVGFDQDRQAIVGTRLHLLLEAPLPAGVRHRLVLPGDAAAIPIVWQPDRVTGSIQASQVGYAPQADKRAFAGNWLGSAGPLPVAARRFEVVAEASGRVALTGMAETVAQHDPWSGNRVLALDFSELREPGRYRIRMDGLGVSDSFRIAPDVYAPLYRSLFRVFFHHRNGMAIAARYADPGHARPEGGVPAALEGVLHPAVKASKLGCGSAGCGRRRVTGGWFDAGDYGQYVPNAAPVWFYIGAALDLAPGRFGDGDLGIPESGNGVPDVLDELDWGMRWLLGMQDPDGGVHFRIASRRWDESLPHRITAPRLIGARTTHATASFAAAAAIHARLMQPHAPERARAALAAAEAAWDFIEAHPQWPAEGERYRNPKGMHAGEYSDASAHDNRLWAAAELLRTTGKDRYRRAYADLADDVGVDPTNPVAYDKQAMAAFWAYLMAHDEPADAAPSAGDGEDQADPALIKQARDAVLESGRWRARMAAAHPFDAPVHHHIGFVGWGSFALSTRATLPLLQAYALSGEPSLLDWAWRSPTPQLGGNPQALCYITGFGARSPRYPLSKLAQYDAAAEPLAGIPVLGPHWHVPKVSPQMRSINAAYAPPSEPSERKPESDAGYRAAYPALRRFTDSDYLPHMSEPTVVDYAQVGVAYGLLKRPGLGAEIRARFGERDRP